MDTFSRLALAPGFDAQYFDPLIAVADAMEFCRDAEIYRERLERILDQAPDTKLATRRIARHFASGLLARINSNTDGLGNLYMDGVTPGVMLTAFEALATTTPFVSFGHKSANKAILERVDGSDRIQVVDLGIGGGGQWIDFMEMAAQHPYVREIVITGIDVPVAGGESAQSLKQTGEMLTAHAERLKLPFQFRGVLARVEDLDMQELRVSGDSAFAVNASFALHHVPTDMIGEASLRMDVLRRIRDLKPRVFTLVEPDVEHNALPLGLRVRESLAHYLAVFDALDTLLAAKGEERFELEQGFFGKEIVNAITGDGLFRVERHERHQCWVQRLQDAGFTQCDLAPFAGEVKAELSLMLPWSLLSHDQALLLAWKDMPIIAASAWQPV